jgi:transposase
MAYRQFQLSKAQQQELKAAEQATKKVSDMKRLMAVRVYGEGYRTDEIEAIVGCTWRSLMRWVEDYQHNGIAGVLDQRRGGNHAKLSAQQRAEVKERLNLYRPNQLLPPSVRVEQGAFWTVSDLKIAVYVWYDLIYQSDTSYRTLLHEAGFSRQQTESQYHSRPSDEVIAEFEALLEKKSPISFSSTAQD